jgi:microcystin degradation protein MlrC
MSADIAIAYILQETNTFSPLLTGLEDFRISLGHELIVDYAGTRTEAGGFIDVLCGAGIRIKPLIAAAATTGGRIRAEEYPSLRAMLQRELRKALPVNGVLLALHGAMCAEGIDDTEGDLLAAVRDSVGPDLPVVVTLDLHANVTAAMAGAAQALIGYRTWPHVDQYETGEAAARLLLRALAGGIRPVTRLCKIPMILPAENMHTGRGPMAEVIAAGDRCGATRPAILSTSVFGVQPWMDIAEMGCATVCVADGDARAALECAGDMALEFWSRRDRFAVRLLPPAEAIEKALAIGNGLVVLGESSDSPSAGAPGDSAELLRELLDRCPQIPGAVWICDPKSVEQAWHAGEGALIRATLGGAYDPANHRPLAVDAVVKRLSNGEFTLTGPFRRGSTDRMGRAAVLETGAFQILVSSRPVSNISADLFRSQGIDPQSRRIMIVKSAGSFRAEYEPFAAGIFMAGTPGICSPDIREIPYRHVPRPIYPLDELAWPRT